MRSNCKRLLKTENSTFGDMFFDSNQQEMIADQLRCYSGIVVGIYTVVPHSVAYDWENPYLKHYNDFYEFRKKEFSFPPPSKEIRIPPAFLPIAKEPFPEIKLNHVPNISCDLRQGSTSQKN